MAEKQKPTKAFDERRTRKPDDDPQRQRQKDEPAAPETNASAKSIDVDDLNARNDI